MGPAAAREALPRGGSRLRRWNTAESVHPTRSQLESILGQWRGFAERPCSGCPQAPACAGRDAQCLNEPSAIACNSGASARAQHERWSRRWPVHQPLRARACTCAASTDQCSISLSTLGDFSKIIDAAPETPRVLAELSRLINSPPSCSLSRAAPLFMRPLVCEVAQLCGSRQSARRCLSGPPRHECRTAQYRKTLGRTHRSHSTDRAAPAPPGTAATTCRRRASPRTPGRCSSPGHATPAPRNPMSRCDCSTASLPSVAAHVAGGATSPAGRRASR